MFGVHFLTMGRHHAARRRTELLPEEVLYLIDRGTLECWTEQDVPLSAQQAFTVMIGAAKSDHGTLSSVC